MCTAENIYYTACGCFSGHHITWLCPRSTTTPGAGTVCPAIDAQGVLRRLGKCLPCRRRDWQQQVLERLLPVRDALPPSGGDLVSDRLTLLSAMIRRAVENSNSNGNGVGKMEDETGNEGQQGKREPDVVAEESTGDEVQQEVVETDSMAWHQE